MIQFATIAAAAAAATSAPAPAPAKTAPPCSAPEYRALDFWVGDWDLDFDAGNGQVGHATNHVTRNEYGDCVISEHFDGGAGGKGGSYSTWDAQTGQWRQTWIDNGGGVFVLVGGPVKDKPWSFELDTVDLRGKPPQLKRMIWQDVTPNALVWRWQTKLPDGTWQDSWVLRYHRRGAPG